MSQTSFWMIRHALVEENARATLYGVMDVELCPHTLIAQAPMYASLARRLPAGAPWVVTPLSRTQRTAEAIFQAGYPRAEWHVEPGLIEQNLGDWQGLAHAALPPLLAAPAHAFWPVGAAERPPGGESFVEMTVRVGDTMDRLVAAYAGEELVVVSHGGTIRAAVAHALGIGAENALHFSVANLSLTRLDSIGGIWRVVSVNELPGY